MAAPILVPNLAVLRAEINARWPKRDRASDGWIGDRAHQGSPSGHNPDETGNAERRDADRIDEVRALDLDKDIDPAPGDELYAELDRIRRTPALRRRLIYIIYQRKICSASNGWRWVSYSGSNPHTEHGHLSGHPDHDDNTAPWGIAGEDDDMAFDAEQERRAWATTKRAEALLAGTDARYRVPGEKTDRVEPNVIARSLAELRAEVEALAARPTTPPVELDYDELARALLRAAARGPAS